jgi:tRNA A-37 threonylcarbamoyl transferase component Bud32
VSAGAACLDIVALARLGRGELSGAGRARAEAHLAGCESCRQALAKLGGHEVGPRLIGQRYRLAERLGAGGMGEVYRAHDVVLRRDVAAKVLRVPDAMRARDEARAVAAVQHPHVVTVHDAFVDDDVAYITMELVEGGKLAGAGLSRRATTEAFLGLADGLAALHAAGIVHGDIKPDNLLWDAAARRAKLGDFGLARAGQDVGADQQALARTWCDAAGGIERAPRALRRVLARALEAGFADVATFAREARRALARARGAWTLVGVLVIAGAVLVPGFMRSQALATCRAEVAGALPVLATNLGAERARVVAAYDRWRAGMVASAGLHCEHDPNLEVRTRCLEVEYLRMDNLMRLLDTQVADSIYHRADLLDEIDALDPGACTDLELTAYTAADQRPLPRELLYAAYANYAFDRTSEAKQRALVAELEGYGPSRALFQALVNLRTILEGIGEDAESVAIASRGVTVALALDDRVTLRRAFLGEAEALLFRAEDPPGARVPLARAKAIAAMDSLHDAEREARVEASIDFLEGNLDDMRRVAEAALARNDRGTGVVQSAYLARVDAMLAHFELGNYASARQLALEALELRLLRAPRRNVRVAGLIRYVGLSSLRMGDLAEAHGLINEARDIRASLLPEGHIDRALIDLAWAELAMAEGQSEASLGTLREALATLDAGLRPRHVDRVRSSIMGARIALQAGDLATARAALAITDVAATTGAWRERFEAAQRAVDDLGAIFCALPDD